MMNSKMLWVLWLVGGVLLCADQAHAYTPAEYSVRLTESAIVVIATSIPLVLTLIFVFRRFERHERNRRILAVCSFLAILVAIIVSPGAFGASEGMEYQRGVFFLSALCPISILLLSEVRIRVRIVLAAVSTIPFALLTSLILDQAVRLLYVHWEGIRNALGR